jgi:hypothetical protein
MLAELRKYGGTFGLATQSLAYLDQLDRTLRPTVLANIDHLYAFEMAAEDARLLVPELEGVNLEDLTNLPDYTCYAKLSLAGQRLPVFSLRLDAPPHADSVTAAAVRKHCLEQTTRPVAEIDAYLEQQRLEHGERRPSALSFHREEEENAERSKAQFIEAVEETEGKVGNSPLATDSTDTTGGKIGAETPTTRRRSRGGRRKKQEQASQDASVIPLTTPDGETPLVETALPPDRPEWYDTESMSEHEGHW